MQDYQQRVVDEKLELDGRLERLTAFTESEGFRKVDIGERSRMLHQAIAMETYSKILSERIDAFVE